MAICKHCEQDMETAESCVKVPVETSDGEFDPVPYGSESRVPPAQPGQVHHGVLLADPPRCHDCNVIPGAYHHPGCDWEECPRCQEQAISCNCNPEPENDEPIN